MAYDRTIPGAVSPEREERLRAWAQRRPRVALMGEFSAGKSTLLNFLIEENLIPTRATATEVPPLWFSHGEGGAYWVDADGVKHPITTAELGSVPMTARYVRVFSQAEILEHCDIVDTPGISDPNLAVESWRFAAGIANMVLWCSSATQAWRETERSAWLSLPERLRRHSVLIVTRADKLVAEGDRDKVHRRLARETAGLFRDRVFMATPDAVRAKAELADGETSPLWEASGAAALLDQLAGRFEAIYAERGALLRQRLTGSAQPVEAEPEPQAVEAALELEAEEESTGPRPTRPVRVQVGSPRRPERLRPEDAYAVISKLRNETPPLAEAAAAVLGAGEEALRGIEPEATAEAAPDGTEPAAESPAVEETFFGPDDDKDDRALREALGLDEPVAESGAAELAEAEAQAEAIEEADHGESEWDAKEEPEAQADEAEAEPGVAMWDTAEEPEAAAEAVEAEEDLAGNAEELDEAVADADERDEVEPEQAEAAAPSELPELMMARVMDWAAEEEAEAPAGEAPAAESGEAAEAGMATEAEPEQAEAAAPSETPELVMAQAIDWVAEEEAEAPDEAVEPEDVASEAESLAEAGAADDALAEAEAEAETEEAGPAESAVEAERPYLLDAEHFVGAGRPQAAVPPAVRVWRAIVARTELLPGNAQIAAMIEELLLVLEAEEAAPEAEAAAAPEPAVEADEVEAEAAGADDGADSERPEAEVVPGGWRRLA